MRQELQYSLETGLVKRRKKYEIAVVDNCLEIMNQQRIYTTSLSVALSLRDYNKSFSGFKSAHLADNFNFNNVLLPGFKCSLKRYFYKFSLATWS